MEAQETFNNYFKTQWQLFVPDGKPDLFITVNCNPHSPEIEQEMKNVSNPDKIIIIARIFKLKLQAILDDIYKNKIFGNVKAKMYVIEFQKRGKNHF